jgi:septum formation protein
MPGCTDAPHDRTLVLASASPRRRQLLLEAGIAHVVRAPSVIEERAAGEDPAVFARRLAQEKACAVPCGPGEVVLGADTIVVLEQEVFGKPRSDADAGEMLRRLSGRDHWVYTGICLRSEGRILNDLAATRVSFCALSDAEIDEYVKTGEPMDKAGGYAIQGSASKFITSIEGSYSNVVGLPVALVYRHLKAIWGELAGA